MANFTSPELPALPAYTLSPRPALLPGIPDILLQLISPVVTYWVVSGFFHILDVYDLFAQYRLHTPAELTKRNHVSRFEVFRDVILQQIIQTVFGLAVAYFDPPEMVGKEDYDIALWARRLRIIQTYLPQLLAAMGINAPQLANRLYDQYPMLASALSGGRYAFKGFASWELSAAKAIYHVVIPAIQFVVAICWVDTWQYFLHRAMHMNRFLYNWLHSRHHRLYVPYAYGALYNHPIEGFALDTLGTGVAYLVTGMTIRQGMVLFVCATIKTVDDHCGYAFPWDPLQHVTSNNAAYHDIHHQSWGIKTNFSQPFFTFWDKLFDTNWKGGDISLRYERDRLNAQRKVDADKAADAVSVTNCPPVDLAAAKQQAAESQKQVLDSHGPGPIIEEIREEAQVQKSLRKPARRRTGSFDPRSTFAERVPALHGRSTPILHADGMH